MVEASDETRGETDDTAETGDYGQVTGAGRERVYTTKEGDTLADLAAFFYGDSSHTARLLRENPELNADTTELQAGMRLRISDDADRGDAVSPSACTPAPQS